MSEAPLEPPIIPPPYRPTVFAFDPGETTGTAFLSMDPELTTVASKMLDDRDDAIKAMTCVNPPLGCGKQITQDEFNKWDSLSRKEYRQSGWCKGCQNKVFGECGPDCGHAREPGVCTCDNPCCEVDVGVGILNCGSQHCPVHGTTEG